MLRDSHLDGESPAERPVSRRMIRRFALAALLMLTAGLCASWFVAGQLIAARPSVVGDPPADLPGESISLASESGARISGWNIPASESRGVLVLVHGIGGSRLAMLSRARLLFEAGYSIVMIDLQAHGESTGKQITMGYLEKHDLHAAVDFAHQKYRNQPVGVIGVSLGAASALLACPMDIDALVLESAYPDINGAVRNRVKQRLGALSAIPSELLLIQLRPRLGIATSALRPIDHVSNAGCPVFLMSGTEDCHTTAQETTEMFHAASEPKELWLVSGAAHVDLFRAAPQEYQERLLHFLDQQLSQSH